MTALKAFRINHGHPWSNSLVFIHFIDNAKGKVMRDKQKDIHTHHKLVSNISLTDGVNHTSQYAKHRKRTRAEL